YGVSQQMAAIRQWGVDPAQFLINGLINGKQGRFRQGPRRCKGVRFTYVPEHMVSGVAFGKHRQTQVPGFTAHQVEAAGGTPINCRQQGILEVAHGVPVVQGGENIGVLDFPRLMIVYLYRGLELWVRAETLADFRNQLRGAGQRSGGVEFTAPAGYLDAIDAG